MAPHQIVSLGLAQTPEGKRLFVGMTVRENLEMGAYLRRSRRVDVKRDIEAIFERFPALGEKQHEKAQDLSGGEQQMLTISRALMTKPSLLLLDEPAQGLSPVAADAMARTVTNLNRDGITIVLIEHNLRLGLAIASCVYVLESGKIALKAETSDLSEVEYAKKIYLGA